MSGVSFSISLRRVVHVDSCCLYSYLFFLKIWVAFGSSGPLVAGSFPTHIHILVERKKALSTSPPLIIRRASWSTELEEVSAVIIKGIVKKGSFLLFMFTHFEWYVSVCLLHLPITSFHTHMHT